MVDRQPSRHQGVGRWTADIRSAAMMSEAPKQSIEVITEPPAAAFSPLEWLVVAIGASRRPRPLHLSRFGRALIDMEAPDMEGGRGASLEALRRASGMARRCGWEMPAIEIGAFLRAGWSEDHLELLIESVSVPFREAKPHGEAPKLRGPVEGLIGRPPSPFRVPRLQRSLMAASA
jgi:hypothetical protein